MWSSRILMLSVIATAATAILFSSTGLSREPSDIYPSKPVTLIVSTAPGGSGDKETRLYASNMSVLMGQPFVMDFKPGAGTTLGAAYVAKARADGHTLLVVTASFTSFPAIYKDLPFDTLRDFAPISLMNRRTTLFLVHPSFPAKNFLEYLAYARAHPRKINYGTSGEGSVSHLAGAWMHSATNTNVTFVPYKGSGLIWADIMAGRLDITPAGLTSALPMINSGKVRVLAIASGVRSKHFAGVQTVAEQGVAGFNYPVWQGISAPGATPATIVNKLSEHFAKVVKAPQVAAALEADGGEPFGSTPAQFEQVIRTETAQWKKIVLTSGIQLKRR